MLFQWKENLWLIRCKPWWVFSVLVPRPIYFCVENRFSVVTKDYKSSDFTVATQGCTPEYYTGDLRVQYTGQIFLGESCGATVTGNFT